MIHDYDLKSQSTNDDSFHHVSLYEIEMFSNIVITEEMMELFCPSRFYCV